jgi:hypothetical protein
VKSISIIVMVVSHKAGQQRMKIWSSRKKKAIRRVLVEERAGWLAVLFQEPSVRPVRLTW